MKKINETYENASYDIFEVPENLWTRVEKKLIEKENKRQGFPWWQVAAAVAVIIGIATFLYKKVGITICAMI